MQEVEEVPLSVAMRDEDGYALPRCAVWGLVLAVIHFLVLILHILHFQQ